MSVQFMNEIDARYRQVSKLDSRDHYSIFYGPLRPSKILMINANPGGTPENYSIVDVYAGQHEYIEGRNSGPTTRNGAEILGALVDNDQERLRGIQVLNRFFRRSTQRPSATIERRYMEEARPFLVELIQFIKPEALIFGGDSAVGLFAKAHGGTLSSGTAIMGPNGISEAVYLREHELCLPYYRSLPAFGIYHPSKLNGAFRQTALPVLKRKLAPFID